jgi:hypothetical protein
MGLYSEPNGDKHFPNFVPSKCHQGSSPWNVADKWLALASSCLEGPVFESWSKTISRED